MLKDWKAQNEQFRRELNEALLSADESVRKLESSSSTLPKIDTSNYQSNKSKMFNDHSRSNQDSTVVPLPPPRSRSIPTSEVSPTEQIIQGDDDKDRRLRELEEDQIRMISLIHMASRDLQESKTPPE